MKSLFLFLLLPVICAFRPGGDQRFSARGVSFTYPQTWVITETDSSSPTGYYLACEKAGGEESGLVTVTWTDSEKDIDAVLEAYKAGLSEQFAGDNTVIRIAKTVPGSYGRFPGKRADFRLDVMGLKSTGTLYTFLAAGKTVTVLAQGDDEDESQNLPGFTAIMQSFDVK